MPKLTHLNETNKYLMLCSEVLIFFAPRNKADLNQWLHIRTDYDHGNAGKQSGHK
jgi:hypothetical protein